MALLVAVKSIAGKGRGTCATRSISPGAAMLEEKQPSKFPMQTSRGAMSDRLWQCSVSLISGGSGHEKRAIKRSNKRAYG